MLWGTINTLQLIVMVTLFNLSYPENAMFTFRLISQITRFNLIPVDYVINAMFSFDRSTPINYNFKMMGYDSSNILQTLDSILVYLIGIVGLAGLTFLFFLFIGYCPKLQKHYQMLSHAVFFNMTLRILLESYIEIFLTSAINIQNLHYTKSGDACSAYLSIALGLFMTILPLMILIFIVSQHSKVESHSARFGALFDGLKTKKISHLLCTFLFISRRFILIVVTVMLSDYPSFQVMSYIFISQMSIIYLLQTRPYLDRATNLNEIFNEGCVLVSSYTLFVFTEYVAEEEVREATGYAIISVIMTNFGVNLLIQGVQSISQLRRMLLRCSYFFRKLWNKIPKFPTRVPKVPDLPDTPFAYHLDEILPTQQGPQTEIKLIRIPQNRGQESIFIESEEEKEMEKDLVRRQEEIALNLKFAIEEDHTPYRLS